MKFFSVLILVLCSISFSTTTLTKEEFKVPPSTLKSLIKENGKTNNIVYTYTDWCSPCIKEFPNVLNFFKENNCKLYIIVLSKDGNADLNKYKEKLKKKYNCNEQLYSFSFSQEFSKGLRKLNYRNYQAFIKELLGEKYNSNMLYGSDNLILMNNNAKIVYIPEFLDYEALFLKLKESLL